MRKNATPARISRLPKALLLLAFIAVSFACKSQLSVDFIPSKTGGCSPLMVSFTNTTTGASSKATYYWDFGNGNSSSILNPSASFTNEISYSVTLTVKDGTNTASKTKTIQVYKKPTVDFSVQSPHVCLPSAGVFTSNATPGDGTLSSFYWDFGDGSTQQGFSSQISHNYTVPQSASVGLTVTNSYGCYNTIQKQNIITIFPSITASFKTDKVFLCTPGESVTFTSTSAGPGVLSFAWDFGDGGTATQQNPVHTYNKSGAFIAKLTVTSSEGCTANTSSVTINVDNFITDFTFPSPVCKNGYIQFNNISTPTPTSSVWTFSNGGIYNTYGNSSVSNYFNQPGSYTLKLQNNFGVCVRTTTKTFDVKDIPNLNGFIKILSGQCGAPVTITLQDTCATSVTWKWDSNNYPYSTISTQQQATYNAATNGYYYFGLTVTNAAGCTASTQSVVNINAPIINIGIKNSTKPITNSCGANTVTFTATSNSDPIATYNWNMGDGTFSNIAEPVHTFTNAGVNTIILSYVTKGGCTGSATYTVPIFSQPVADFVAASTTICGNNTVNFRSLTIGATTGYYWDLGKGNYGSGAAPSINYNDTGLYTIKMIVYNGGCTDTAIKKNYITVLPPFPNITGTLNTCNDTRGDVKFTQKSRLADSIIWNFGDNSGTVSLRADSASFIHTYKATGTYTVYLTAVKDNCRVSAVTSVSVLLKQSPILTLNKNAVCSYDQAGVTISNYQLNPTVGINQASYYPNFYYDDNTAYGYNFSTPNGNWTNVFTGTLNGFVTGKQNIYAVTTSYYFGCKDTTNIAPLKVNGAVVKLTIVKDNQCFQSPVIVNGTATSTSQISKWVYSFGDGSTLTANSNGDVSHQYATPGYYTVSLTATDATGCTSTSSISVQVNGPKAAFTTSGTNVPLNTTVSFYNNTNNFNSYNTQYQWFFGDGNTTTNPYPTYTYTVAGTYLVKLIATNPITGCTDTAVQTIVVRNFNSAFNFNSSFITNTSCPPVIVRFNNTSVGYTSVKWDFGDGITSVAFSPTHIYSQPGNYIITLLAYGYNGLIGTYIDSIKINTDTTNIVSDKLGGCLPQQIKLSAADQIIGNYYWDFGDGTISKATDSFYVHNYLSPGVYQPRLLLQNKDGCTSAINLQNKINISDGPIITLGPKPATVCLGSSVALTVVGGTKFVWSPANTLNNNAVSNPIATPIINTIYTVTATDNLGCTRTDSLKVIVFQPFNMTVSTDTFVCKGAFTTLTATGAYAYQWINNIAELSNPTSGKTIATPINDVTYTVVGKDSSNCFSDTGNIKIKVIPLPTVNVGPDIQTQAGTAIQLNATTSSDVINWHWTPTIYLTCSNCAAPQATLFAPETYIATVQNKYGCQASDTINVSLTCLASVNIPTAFSPNGDGKNDVFQIKGNGVLIKHFVIYGRMGNIVFERSNLYIFDSHAAWDGNYQGQPMPDGAYVYFAQLSCPATGAEFTEKGTVLLVR